MITGGELDPLTGVRAARFAIYVHFPWCLSKCPYCDFASVVSPQIPQASYADAIVTELRQRAEGHRGRVVHSVYFGGGTPSLWGPEHVGRVLKELASLFTLDAQAELTLEANPGAADVERFSKFRALGINRLSIGVQSFNPRTLAALGRAHSPDDARAAFRGAREAGFDNVSLDFIYGVHGQTAEEAAQDAREAAALGPDHLSAYALTLSKEALAEEVPLARQLARGELALPPDEEVTRAQRLVAEAYERAGLQRYEVSNYARSGRESLHNLAYWTGGEWLAVGVGATGSLRHAAHEGLRYQNQRSPEKYLRAVAAQQWPEAGREDLDATTLFRERVAMGLRLVGGIDLLACATAFGQESSSRADQVRFLEKHGLLTSRDGRWALTPRGFDLHSEVALRLM